jgi:uncharacterized protein YggE
MKGEIMIRIALTASALAIFALEATAQEFDRPYWLDRSVIEALGRSDIRVPADMVTFSVTFREVDEDSRDAMFAASDRARLAAAAIRSRGGDGVQITSRADIQAIHQEYRNREGERLSSERDDRIDNYAVSVTLTVVIRDVSRAMSVRAAAMAVGPEATSDLTYSLDETSPSRLRAYRAAVQDAAARARIAAEASGSPIGGLLVLQDGNGPCLGSWQAGTARDAIQVRAARAQLDTATESVVVTARGPANWCSPRRILSACNCPATSRRCRSQLRFVRSTPLAKPRSRARRSCRSRAFRRLCRNPR